MKSYLIRFSFFAFFIMLIGCEDSPSLELPTLTTMEATDISIETARSGGVIISDGNNSVFERGICWSDTPNPTISDHATLQGGGSGSFTSDLINLISGTTYYVRAYATNDLGTAYGNQIEFTTNVTLTSITIASSKESIAKGLTAKFIASGKYSNNTTKDITGQVDWTNSNTSVGSINNSDMKGFFSSSGIGTTTIKASLGNVTSSNQFSVTKAELISITINTETTTVMPSSTQLIKAVGGYTDNTSNDISTEVNWSSSNSTIAFISNAEGILRNISAGEFGDAIIKAELNNVSATLPISVKLLVGKEYAGGIVFYIDSTGKHGLVMANTDQSAGVIWWVGNWTYIDAPSITPDRGIGAGKSNTAIIVATQGNGSYAAKICDDLILNGFSDWFLPSIDELQLICQNLYTLKIGSLSDQFYWSSTDTSRLHNAWWMQFSNGCQLRSDLGRNMENRVRAVREF